MSFHRRRAVLTGAAAALLGGCGFELRRAPQMAFQTIALQGFAPRSPLAEHLRQQLSRRVQVLPGPDKADVVLHALADARERGVVATTAAAQVREVQLRLRVNLRARTPAGRELMPPMEVLLTRDMSYSEAAALSKAEEEAQLYREMEADVAQQVMRRLAAIRL